MTLGIPQAPHHVARFPRSTHTTVFDFEIPARSAGKVHFMDVVYQRVAGLDIHKKIIVACRILPGNGSQVQREVRSFGTTTLAIEQLADWLEEGGATHVAMEATGVYWKPVFNLLEDRFELVLANAQHIKTVPGQEDRRKRQ